MAGTEVLVDRWREAIPALREGTLVRYCDLGVWTQSTIGQKLHEVALRFPEADAVVSVEGSVSYRELDERTDRIAAGLVCAGLTPGDAVLLQVGNSIETVVAWYAIIKSGAIPVATLLMHRAHEIGQIGGIVEARAHLVDASYPKSDLVAFSRKMAGQSGGDRLLFTVRADRDHKGFMALEKLGSDMSAPEARETVEAVAARIAGDDVAVFQLSGGTTAIAKVIPRSHDDYWYNAESYARALGWDHRVRTMHILPVIHNAGVILAVHAAHSVGAAVVLGPDTPAPSDVLDLMASARVTDVVAYPALALEWRNQPAFDQAVANLQRIVLTGAPVTDEAFSLFESRGVKVLGLYGATEGLLCVTRPTDSPAVRQHTLGTPISEYDVVRIIEPDTGLEAADGVAGELCYQGPTTLRGYLNAPERNAEAFTKDGLFRSGDLVARRVVDGAVAYTFEGRIKDLVNRGGEKVNSAEIEGLITEIPGIRRAALIPVPDPRLGERACLCVELKEGAASLTLLDITKFLENRGVAKFKWPERLEFFGELPSTHVGKLDKRRITAHVATLDAASSPTANEQGAIA